MGVSNLSCFFFLDLMERVDGLMEVFLCQLDAPGVPTKKKGRCGCTARPHECFSLVGGFDLCPILSSSRFVYSHHMSLVVDSEDYCRGCWGIHPKTFH